MQHDLDIDDGPEYDWRHENLPRIFLGAYKYCEGEIEKQLRKTKYANVRSVHLGVMREMNIDGTRISTLARRCGVTKQAMSQLVSECEKIGIVKRTADPSDGRAKIVVFTRTGLNLINHSKGIIESIEREITEAIGATRAKRMKSALQDVWDLVITRR